jgi:hypothetical protein
MFAIVEKVYACGVKRGLTKLPFIHDLPGQTKHPTGDAFLKGHYGCQGKSAAGALDETCAEALSIANPEAGRC